ncbi:CBS domain-containing protein [Arcobacteraceae bacterium]|nr:CBS domain-containing protein [Arcobacteraceae bacterium]
MFSMYDDDGLNFRNNIDHLYSVHEVARSQKLKNSIKDEDKNKENFQETLYKGKITKEATNAYKQMTNLDTREDIYHVEQIMSHNVITVDDTKTVAECYELMKEHKIQQIPIIAENKLHVKGIITRHDILKFLINDLESSNENISKPISDISSKKIITTDPISDIRRVSQVMIDFNLNAMPVVNSLDILVGIVSRNDIVKAVASLPHLQLWA